MDKDNIKQDKLDEESRKEISGFCLNFRPVEEFYDQGRVEAEERLKKMKMYNPNEISQNAIVTPIKFGDTMSTQNPLGPIDLISRFNPNEFSPSPMKAPSQLPNKYKIDYSSMVTQPITNNGSVTDADSGKVTPVDKENIYDLEPGLTVV